MTVFTFVVLCLFLGLLVVADLLPDAGEVIR